MSTLPKTLIKVTCLSIALLGATAVVTTMMVPDAAYAKNDKAKDKGNGNGKDKSKDRSAKAKGKKAAKPVKIAKAGGCGSREFNGNGGVAAEIGVHPCALGNLNAWNNNSGNTNPNSMPGMLAGYEGVIAANLVLQQAVDDALFDVGLAPLPADLTPYLETTTCSDDGFCTYDTTGLVDDPLVFDEDYDLLTAYNGYVDTLITAEMTQQTQAVDERMALEDIANKDLDDPTFNAIRNWIIANLGS